MRNAQGAFRLAPFGHGIAIQCCHKRIRCPRCVEQNGGYGTANGRPLHHPNQKSQNRQQRIGIVTKCRNQNGQRNRHRNRPRQPRGCAHQNAQKETRNHHYYSDRNGQAENRKCLGPLKDGQNAQPYVVKHAHQTSPLGGNKRSSNGRS